MRKSNFIVFAIISLALLLSLGFFTKVQNNYTDQNKNTVLSLQNVASEGKSKTTVKDYLELYRIYEEVAETAFSCQLPDQEVYETQVTPVLINHNYLDYNNIEFEGEGITVVMENAKERTAVISRTFAQEKFYGDTAIGKTFKLKNLRYRVTGIYDDKNDSLNNLFKDGKERIYIPYTAVDKYESQKLTSFCCNSGTRIARLFPKMAYENFQKVDFTEKNLAVNTFTSIILFILAIVIAVYLIKIWIVTLKSSIAFTKTNLKKQYISAFLGKNSVQIIIRFLVLIAIPAGILGLFILSLKDFYIVEKYIDKENLFSISNMIEQLAVTLEKESTTLFAGNLYQMNLYNGTLLLLAGMTPVVSILFFFSLYAGVKATKDSRFSQIIVAGIFLIITIISLICSMDAFFWVSAFITGIYILIPIYKAVNRD